MTGLLVIFSALGGTTGSMVTGYVFGNFNGHFAFYLTLVPITLAAGDAVLLQAPGRAGGVRITGLL